MMFQALEQAGRTSQSSVRGQLKFAFVGFQITGFAKATTHGLDIVQVGIGRQVKLVVVPEIRFVPSFVPPVSDSRGSMSSWEYVN